MLLKLVHNLRSLYWGTGMIASSSTFRPHPGRVTGISPVCHMLYSMVCLEATENRVLDIMCLTWDK